MKQALFVILLMLFITSSTSFGLVEPATMLSEMAGRAEAEEEATVHQRSTAPRCCDEGRRLIGESSETAPIRLRGRALAFSCRCWPRSAQVEPSEVEEVAEGDPVVKEPSSRADESGGVIVQASNVVDPTPPTTPWDAKRSESTPPLKVDTIRPAASPTTSVLASGSVTHGEELLPAEEDYVWDKQVDNIPTSPEDDVPQDNFFAVRPSAPTHTKASSLHQLAESSEESSPTHSSGEMSLPPQHAKPRRNRRDTIVMVGPEGSDKFAHRTAEPGDLSFRRFSSSPSSSSSSPDGPDPTITDEQAEEQALTDIKLNAIAEHLHQTYWPEHFIGEKGFVPYTAEHFPRAEEEFHSGYLQTAREVQTLRFGPEQSKLLGRDYLESYRREQQKLFNKLAKDEYERVGLDPEHAPFLDASDKQQRPHTAQGVPVLANGAAAKHQARPRTAER